MLGCLRKLQYEIRNPVPKGPFNYLHFLIIYIFNVGARARIERTYNEMEAR